MERPWLKEAKAKQDWDKGLLNLDSGARKVTLGIYLDQYHGKIQWESLEVTTQFGYDSNDAEDVVANRVHNHISARNPISNRTGTFQEVGPSEYIVPCQEDEDSNKVIASWLMEKPIYGVKVEPSDLEPSYSSGDQLETTMDPWAATLVVKHFPKDQCEELDIGLPDQPWKILVSKHLTPDKRNTGKKFFMGFSSTFAWSYKDLKGISREVCQHHIILEEGAKPIKQRQRQLNPKYSLLVKEELDKLLDIGFIYPVSFSEWVSPIVILPKKNGKLHICQDF